MDNNLNLINNNTLNQERMIENEAFNLVKGTLMLLIFIHHTLPCLDYDSAFKDAMMQLVGDFLIPPFLIISGYKWKMKYDLKTSAKTLLGAYCISAVLTVIVCFVLSLMFGYGPELAFFKCARRGISFAIGGSSMFYIMGQQLADVAPAWFLLMLFFATIFYSFLKHKVGEDWMPHATAFMTLAGLLLMRFLPLPGYFEQGLAATFYIHLGQVLKHHYEWISIGPKSPMYWLFGIVGIAFGTYGSFNFCYGTWDHFIIDYIGSGILSMFVLWTLLAINRFKFPGKGFIESIGKGSLIIMVIHTVEGMQDTWNILASMIPSAVAGFFVIIIARTAIIYAIYQTIINKKKN